MSVLDLQGMEVSAKGGNSGGGSRGSKGCSNNDTVVQSNQSLLLCQVDIL